MNNLSLKEKIGYGFGDAASSMFWKLFTIYLLVFYTDVFGIHPEDVAYMFVITRTWDALFDPLVGILGDRTETKWGKFRPYLLWIALPFGIMGVLTFTSPELSLTNKLIYAYVTYSLMMMVYSLINVPYASLMGVMSSDGKERTTLATFRFLFAFGGSILVVAIFNPLVQLFSKVGGGEVNVRLGWQFAAGTISVLAVIFFLLTFSWTRERVKPVTNDTSLKHDVTDLLKNWPWFILLLSGIALIFFNSIRDGVAVYYFKYYVHEKGAFNFKFVEYLPSVLYLIVGQAANLLGVSLAPAVSGKIGKKKTFLFAMLSVAIFSFGFYYIPMNNYFLIFLFQFLISGSAGIIFPLVWSMYADAADYSEWKTGRRSTGLVFSASSMSQKFGWTLGGSLAAYLLFYYGFKANVEQSEFTLSGIRYMMSFIPGIGALLGALFMLIYPLSETFMKRIAGDLEERRTPIKVE